MLPGSIYTPAPDIPLRLETVQRYGLVIIRHSLGSILQEKPAGSPVQIGRRVLRLFPYIFVEIFDRLIKLLCKEIRHTTAEIKPDVTRA